MLRDELIFNCNNKIHITYYGTDDEKDKISKYIDKELTNNSNINIDYLAKDNNGLNIEIAFDSKWVAPLQFLQYLCNKYNIDIIGIAYEFDGGYVEAFELKNQLIKEEITHDVILIEETNSGLEEITELPKTQDEDIVQSEFPNSDDLDFSDFKIL